jgi:predicted hydrolase (HD superfamily)
MITREEAVVLVKKYLRNKENIQFSLASEAILRKLAQLLGEDEELWGFTGLLFNIDYEYTEEDRQNRGNISAQILEGLLPKNGIDAIKANHYIHTDHLPVASLDKALIATVAVVDLIFKTINSIPSKNIAYINPEMLLERLNDSSFTSDNKKSRIKLCVDNDIKIEDFLKLSLQTLTDIAENIGL